MKVVDKLDSTYHNPVSKAKDAILKWAKKLKTKTIDQIWTEQDIVQFKEHWLHYVLYNKDAVNDSNCINNFEQLGVNIHGFIGEMKNVEAKYFTFPHMLKQQSLDDITSQKNMAYNTERINLFNNINVSSDFIPNIMSIDTIELNEIVQNVQKIDFFNVENDDDDDDTPDESKLSFLSISNQAETSWNDVTFEGLTQLNGQFRKLCEEYSDVFPYMV